MPQLESNTPRASFRRRALVGVAALVVLLSSVALGVGLAIYVADLTESWLARQPGFVQKVGGYVPAILLAAVVCVGGAIARAVWETTFRSRA